MVAIKGETIVVNMENPVTFLTFDQLRSIFNGTITSWSEVGGPDKPIEVVAKGGVRSVRIFLTEVIKDDAIRGDAGLVEEKEHVSPEVEKRPWPIGLTSLLWTLPAIDRIQLVRPGTDDSEDRTTFAIASPMLLFTRADTDPEVSALIEFVLSEQAQLMLAGGKYAPVATAEEAFRAME